MSWLHWAGKNAKTFTEGKRAQGVIVEQDREPTVNEADARRIVQALERVVATLDSQKNALTNLGTVDVQAAAILRTITLDVKQCVSTLERDGKALRDLADGASPDNIRL